MSKSNLSIVRRPRRKISLSDQAVIIYLHYGSLNDYSTPRMTPTIIARTLRLPITTVHAIISRFALNGNKILSRRRNCGQK